MFYLSTGTPDPMVQAGAGIFAERGAYMASRSRFTMALVSGLLALGPCSTGASTLHSDTAGGSHHTGPAPSLSYNNPVERVKKVFGKHSESLGVAVPRVKGYSIPSRGPRRHSSM